VAGGAALTGSEFLPHGSLRNGLPHRAAPSIAERKPAERGMLSALSAPAPAFAERGRCFAGEI